MTESYPESYDWPRIGSVYSGEPLRVCYLRHAYGMGEHYNSIGLAAGSDHEFEQN